MSEKQRTYSTFNYDAHARTCAPEDFLGQVRRTVNGVPLGDDQLGLIKQAMAAGLSLEPDDVLLELACGNGALSQCLFASCKGYLGIDVSEYLVSVAQQHFERAPTHRFLAQGGVAYVREETEPARFSKVLCYAGFQYFPDGEAAEILAALHTKFTRVGRIFIGNLPDKDQAAKFYRDRTPSAEELADPTTAVGIWRTRPEFSALAAAAGWKITLSTMPPTFQPAYYRYDAVLSR